MDEFHQTFIGHGLFQDTTCNDRNKKIYKKEEKAKAKMAKGKAKFLKKKTICA